MLMRLLPHTIKQERDKPAQRPHTLVAILKNLSSRATSTKTGMSMCGALANTQAFQH